MTTGSEKKITKEWKMPKNHPQVDTTFFRADLKVARGEASYFPWRVVPKDHGGGAKKETEHTNELDRRYKVDGIDGRPVKGSAYVTTEWPEGWEEKKAEQEAMVESLMVEQEAMVESRSAKHGKCPDCGYYLSLKNSCCPSGKMLVCMECAYTKTYEGKL
jgi:formylmethanofuran dehydrogenase subunit E